MAWLLCFGRMRFKLDDYKYEVNKMCLLNTMPPIMANSNEGQDHKDKCFDTSRKILSQEMTMYNMEAFCILSLRSYDQVNFFFNWSNVKVKRLSTYKRSHHKGYSCKISKL